MNEYETDKRPGSISLEEIARCIRLAEAGGMKFVKCEIQLEGEDSNLMYYEVVEGFPPSFKLVPKTTAAPAGFKKEWEGRMLELGRKRDVILYRKK